MNDIEKQKNTKKAKKCLAKKSTIAESLRHMISVNEKIVFTVIRFWEGKDATITGLEIN